MTHTLLSNYNYLPDCHTASALLAASGLTLKNNDPHPHPHSKSVVYPEDFAPPTSPRRPLLYLSTHNTSTKGKKKEEDTAQLVMMQVKKKNHTKESQERQPRSRKKKKESSVAE
jgi:hypothetical protein